MQTNHVPGQCGHFLLMDIIFNYYNLLMSQGWGWVSGPFSALEDGQSFPLAHSDTQHLAEKHRFLLASKEPCTILLERSAVKTTYMIDTFKKVW